MKLLAIDTSSNACSVALQVADDVLDKHVVEPRAHTRILMPMITELLAEGGVSLQQLDAIVLGNGPGSFIGMRIGASVAQGLCHGADLPIVPVSSLLAIAVEAFADSSHDHLVVAQDARMNEVYLGSFKRGEDGLPEVAAGECIAAVAELPTPFATYAAAGAAWERYADLVAANSRQIDAQLSITVPRASNLLGPARIDIDAGRAIAPETLTPAYLRNKVAEKPAPR